MPRLHIRHARLNLAGQLGWQAHAVAAYQHLNAQAGASARSELALRVRQLTGRAIDSRAIYVDHDTHIAVVSVDGVLFRLRRQQLVLVRPCPCCGLGQYESAPIASAADLGFALGAWQPHCANCLPEDPLEI